MEQEIRNKRSYDRENETWLRVLRGFNDTLQHEYYSRTEIVKSIGSIAQRQVELVRNTNKMIEWAVKPATSRGGTPKLDISDFVSYHTPDPYFDALNHRLGRPVGEDSRIPKISNWRKRN